MPFTLLALPRRSSDHLAIPCPLPTTASGPAGSGDLGETKTTLPLGPPSMGVRDYDGETEAQQAEWWWGRGVAPRPAPDKYIFHFHLPGNSSLAFVVCRNLLFVIRLIQNI